MANRPNFFEATAQRVLDAALAHDGYYITVDNAHDSARQATLDVIANTLKNCVEASIHHYAREKIMAEFLGPAHPTSGRPQWGSALGHKIGREFAEAHQLLEWLIPAVYKGDPFCTEEQRRKRQWLELAGEYGYKDMDAVRWAYRRWKEQDVRVDFGAKVKFGDPTVKEPNITTPEFNAAFNKLVDAVDRGLQATGTGRVVTDFHKEGYPAAEDAAGDDGPLVPAGMSSPEASKRAASVCQPLGVEEGERCSYACGGTMQFVRVEPCTCMHNPQGVPCYGCSNSVLECNHCGRKEGELLE